MVVGGGGGWVGGRYNVGILKRDRISSKQNNCPSFLDYISLGSLFYDGLHPVDFWLENP